MIGESFCPHCDMGIVPTRSKLPWTHKFRKCQHCHGDWRNYVKKPEPQPDVHPTNHMDALPPMEEYMVSQFNALSQKESDAYSKMLNCKFHKPLVYEGPDYSPGEKAFIAELEAKFAKAKAEFHAEKSAVEYSQLMDLTLTYRLEDVYDIMCPSCYGASTAGIPDDLRCKLCHGSGSMKVVPIKPAP